LSSRPDLDFAGAGASQIFQGLKKLPVSTMLKQ
jgi:hypothetical protein